MSDERWVFAGGRRSGRRLAPDLAVAGGVFVVTLAVVVAAWSPVFRLDGAIVDALNEVVSRSGRVASVLHFLTDLGGAEAAWLLIPLAVVWLVIRRAARTAVFAVVAGLGAAALDPGVKALVGRARPLADIPVATAPGASFPSGHALGSTLTYGVLLLIFLPAVPPRRRRAVALTAVALVAVVGITRVALGVHHPSDVVAGWSLGVLWLGLANLAVLGRDPSLLPDDRPGDDPSMPARQRRPVLPEGARSVALLIAGAVLLWGALVALGELLSRPRGVVLAFDAATIDWLVGIRTPWLSELAHQAGRLGGTVGIVTGLVIALVVALALTRDWRPPLFLLVAVVGESAIFFTTVTIVERGRPQAQFLTENLPPTPSFPSGHAAAAVALWGGAALLVWAWRRDWLGTAALGLAGFVALGVALSRLYRGVHYPTDVLVSLAYAAAWLAICWAVLRPRPPPAASAQRRLPRHPATAVGERSRSSGS